MADTGRRDVIRDPLADVGSQVQDRSLSVSGVSSPSNGSPSNSGAAAAFQSAVSGLEEVLGQAGEISKDRFITQGKMAYMSGKTEADLIKNGNRFTREGYTQLQTQDGANKWYMEQKASIATDFTQMDPAAYQEHLNKQRDNFLSGIKDPAAQKIATAAFEQYSPDLVAAQFSANNEFNRGARINSFGQLISSTSVTAPSASNVRDGELQLSSMPVQNTLTPSGRDRDIGIRTILGEAGGEGVNGMAAVAHVLRNRAEDGRWPDSIAGVSLQNKQFSTWNTGAGGNSGSSVYGPGNPIYERAGKVFDAVMSGKHVDPTNGATHYYSPAGMKKLVDDGAQGNDVPSWLSKEAAASNGVISIGGHRFVGRGAKVATSRADTAPTSAMPADTGMIPNGKAANGLDAAFNANLNRFMADAPGGGISVYSGYRSPEHQAEIIAKNAGKYGLDRGAWESDVKSMGAIKAGQKWAGKFKSSGMSANIGKPGGSHHQHGTAADLSYDSKAKEKWAHDNAAKYGLQFRMSHEGWHIEPIEGADHGAATGVQVASSANQTQELILGYGGLSPADKAQAVASQMHAQLQAGNDTLFRDGGGIGMLQQLNATPDQIAQVTAAANAFNAKKLDSYNVEAEKWRAEVIADAESGKDVTGILNKIKERDDAKAISDGDAQSLAREVLSKSKAAKDKISTTDGNVQYMTEIGSLYQQITAGGLDFEGAAASAKAIGTKYGAKPEDVNSVVGQMFSLDQSRKNKLQADVAAAREKFVATEQAKSEVSSILSQGYGLNTASGDIATVTAAGAKVSISKQAYGIQSIKDKHTNEWKSKLDAGVVSENEAKTGIIVDTFKELQQHQVIDKETQGQIVGALSGSLTDKDGNLTASAQKAYDLWQILRNNPDVKKSYLAQTVGNEDVRGLLETAHVLEGGNLTGSEALRRAHELLQDPLRDPEARIAKDAIWTGKLEKGVKDAISDKTALTLMEQAGFGTNHRMQGFGASDKTKAEWALAERGTARALTFVQNRAEAYHMNNPNLDATVSMEMGLHDLEGNMTVVEGNVLISAKESVSKVMGIEQYGNAAPRDAIGNYLQEYGQDIWGDDYVGTPQYNITMNETSGVLTVDIYKDIDKGIMLGKPQHFDLKSIGKSYVEAQTKKMPWDDMWNGMFSLAGDGLNAIRNNDNAMHTGPTVVSPVQ